MKIYIGGLWPRVTRAELQKLIDKVIKRPWYKIGGERVTLQSCSLLQMVEQGRSKNSLQYSGVVDVQPNRLAWQVVEALDGMVVHGRKLQAHRWFPRNGLPDRRASLISEGEAQDRYSDRRFTKDRRKLRAVQDPGQALTKGVKGFERSYGR